MNLVRTGYVYERTLSCPCIIKMSKESQISTLSSASTMCIYEFFSACLPGGRHIGPVGSLDGWKLFTFDSFLITMMISIRRARYRPPTSPIISSHCGATIKTNIIFIVCLVASDVPVDLHSLFVGWTWATIASRVQPMQWLHVIYGLFGKCSRWICMHIVPSG